MSFIETDLGFIKEKDNHILFFGKNSATLEQIKQAYSHLTFREVTQKHTDICITSKANNSDVIADAHFTTEPNIALIVKTADCQPILAYDKDLILAIHAGWRGVENQITSKSLLQAGLKQAEIFVGPCIQQSSFEVDLDVKQQLENISKIVHDSSEFKETFVANNNKYHIDLTQIVKAEIKAASRFISLSL